MRAIKELTLADVMQTAVRTISADATLLDASEKIAARHVTALPVMNEHGRCIGILSATDLQQFADRADPHSPHYHLRDRDTATTQVGELMTRRVVSVRIGTPLSEVAQTFSRLGLHHVPVLGETDNLEGIVSLSDLP